MHRNKLIHWTPARRSRFDRCVRLQCTLLKEAVQLEFLSPENLHQQGQWCAEPLHPQLWESLSSEEPLPEGRVVPVLYGNYDFDDPDARRQVIEDLYGDHEEVPGFRTEHATNVDRVYFMYRTLGCLARVHWHAVVLRHHALTGRDLMANLGLPVTAMGAPMEVRLILAATYGDFGRSWKELEALLSTDNVLLLGPS